MKKLRISIYLLVLTFSCLEIDGNTAVQSGMNIYEKGIFPLEEQQLANSASGMPDAINNDRNIFENSSASVIQFDPPRESSSNIYNEVAQQLAGLYIPDARRDNSIYIDYARFIGAEWKNLSEVSLSKIEDWSNTNIVPHLKNSETLFYPFGGPDIAYALKFFPGMQNYILIGLEPIGNFESIQKSIGNESAILALKQAFSQYLKQGYFITSQMMVQLSDSRARGALYLILIELVKSGCVINLIEDLSIDSEGHETPRQKGMVDCVKVIFTPLGSKISQNVYYVRANLCNDNGKLPHVINFVKRFSFATFIKSASYVLHDKTASQIRDFILENTKVVLQDDTGIPFRYFDAKWEKNIFGMYTQPTLLVFKAYKQQNLSNYYATHNPLSIGFKIGYGFNKERPNLLLAIPTYREIIQQMQNLRQDVVATECPCKNKKVAPAEGSSKIETISASPQQINTLPPKQNKISDDYKKALTELLSF